MTHERNDKKLNAFSEFHAVAEQEHLKKKNVLINKKIMFMKSNIPLNKKEGLKSAAEELKRQNHQSLASDIRAIVLQFIEQKEPTLCRNEITHNLEKNGRVISEEEIDEIFSKLKSHYPNEQEISKDNVVKILNSDWTFLYNPIQSFFLEAGPLKTYSAIPAIVESLQLQSNPKLEYYFDADTKRVAKIVITEWFIDLVRSVFSETRNGDIILLSGANDCNKQNFFKQLLPAEIHSYYSQSNYGGEQNAQQICESLLHHYTYENFTDKELEELDDFICSRSFAYIVENDLKLNRSQLASLAITCMYADYVQLNDQIDVYELIIQDIDWEKFMAVDKKDMLREALHWYEYDDVIRKDPRVKYLTILDI